MSGPIRREILLLTHLLTRFGKQVKISKIVYKALAYIQEKGWGLESNYHGSVYCKFIGVPIKCFDVYRYIFPAFVLGRENGINRDQRFSCPA